MGSGMTDRPADWDRAAKLFEQALALDEAAREAFLREGCADDAALQNMLRDMLRAQLQQGEFLAAPSVAGLAACESARQDAGTDSREEAVREGIHAPGIHAPAASRTTQLATPTEKPGDRIGRYKLLQKIGEGGFGEVWMAEQLEPVRRKVALKI